MRKVVGLKLHPLPRTGLEESSECTGACVWTGSTIIHRGVTTNSLERVPKHPPQRGSMIRRHIKRFLHTIRDSYQWSIEMYPIHISSFSLPSIISPLPSNTPFIHKSECSSLWCPSLSSEPRPQSFPSLPFNTKNRAARVSKRPRKSNATKPTGDQPIHW